MSEPVGGGELESRDEHAPPDRGEDDSARGRSELSRTRRGQLKKKVTIGMTQISTLMKQKDSEEVVQVLVRKLQSDFKTFCEYHRRLHDTLPGAEQVASAKYFDEVKGSYENKLAEADQWLKEGGTAEEEEMSGEESDDSTPGATGDGLMMEKHDVENPLAERHEGTRGSVENMTLKMLHDIAARLTKLEETRPEASRPAAMAGDDAFPEITVESSATATPTPRTSTINSARRRRVSFGGMSTIEEVPSHAESQREGVSEELAAIRSMAESFRMMADKKDPAQTEAFLSMATSFKMIAEKNCEMVNASVNASVSKNPKFNLFDFSGLAIDYVPFIRAFDTQVAERFTDPAIRLRALLQHTKGDLHELLKFCVLKETPELAYKRAREILAERFERYEDLSQAWLDRLAATTPVQTLDELLKLNTSLINCRETLMAVKQLRDFETKPNLMVVIQKLPRFIRTRWQEKVVDIQESEGRSAKLEDLIALTRRVYREKADPIYGGALVENIPEQRYQTKYPKQARQSYAVMSEPGMRDSEQVNAIGGGGYKNKQFIFGCICCGDQHTLYKCPVFKDMLPPDRLKMVLDKKACTNCFHPKHEIQHCKSLFRCQVCKGNHHTMLHIDGSSNVNMVDLAGDDVSRSESRSEVVTATLVRGKVALPVVPVVLHGPSGVVRMFALLDQGSTCSICTESVAEKLGLERSPHVTYINTVDRARVEIRCSIVDMVVESLYKGSLHSMSGVITRNTLNLSARCRAYPEEINAWPHLRHLDLPTADVEDIDLLIGMSHPGFLTADRTIKGTDDLEPFASETVLGWYVGGPMTSQPATRVPDQYCNAILEEEGDSIAERLDRLWRIDGISCDPSVKGLSVADQQVTKEWEEKMYHDGRNYHVPIPFKNREEFIPNNRADAERHLRAMERQLMRMEPKQRQECIDAMLKNITDELAEPIPDHELQGPLGKTWYLIFHFVRHARKDVPRAVFNPSRKFGKKSLNHYIHQGPDFMNQLVDVLLKWRQDRTTVNGDIKGMFNQILVTAEDRDCQRFLFWKDGVPGNPVVEYRMKSHIFGGVWSPSCANFTLKKCADDFAEPGMEEAQTAIKERFYVDDGLHSTSGAERAVKLYSDIDTILSRGGFTYTKLISNDDAVIKRLPRDKLAKTVDLVALDVDTSAVECVLGNYWRPKSDLLVYIAAVPEKPATRRGLLGTVSSIYDPLGLVGPVTVKAKGLFQETCRRGKGWDDVLDSDVAMAWEDWKQALKEIGSLEFQRCFLPEGLSLADALMFDLHHFSDASIRAYGAAGYVCVIKDARPVGVALVMAKGKLAPIKTPPVPRLELTAAQSAVQLDLVCKRALTIAVRATYFWTDSTIVLWYISNPEIRCMTFVQNKINFIMAHTVRDQWRHVPTAMNPADIISRGATPAELAADDRWSHGPPFLMEDQSRWPERLVKLEVDSDKLEVKKEELVLTCAEPDFDPVDVPLEEVEVTLCGGTVGAGAGKPRGLTRDPCKALLDHYSSWYRMRKAVVIVAKLCYYKTRKELFPVTTVEMLRKAEYGILRYLQKPLRDGAGKITKQYLRVFPTMVDGLIRVGGRLARAEIHPDQKHPIVLPESSATTAIVWAVHACLGHAGPDRVHSEVRKKYWIIHGKGVVMRILDKCIPCKKLKAPYLCPEMSDLHRYRVTGEDMPFFNTGVDYFGPLTVKERRVVRKRYGVLFTCMQTRAIHLELAWSLEMDSCILAVFRFASRRGMPRNMKSDNGTNLVGAQAEMRKEIRRWNKEKMAEVFLQKECNWSFNTPTASHMGGVWERQIRSVRMTMISVLGNLQPTEETLLTVLAIMEDILNNRPITPVNTDARDLGALTPNHFLKLNTAVRIPLIITDDRDAYRRRWRQVQQLADLYWTRWREEYLVTLQERKKWCRAQKNLAVGDLVVVRDDFAPRNTWPLARVLQVYPDEKGVVRSAEILSSKGQFRRPVNKMCLVEGCP